MEVAAFATGEPLSHDELANAPLRSLPRPSRLSAELDVKPKRAAVAAEALGLLTVGHLIEHFPRDHADRREAAEIADLPIGEEATVVAQVRRISSRRARGRLTLQEATVVDPTGPMKAVWFNQPWLVDKLPAGTSVVLHGRYNGPRRGLTVKEYEIAPEATSAHSTGVVPVYRATEHLSSNKIREMVWNARDAIRNVTEPLPAWLRLAERLPERAAAVDAIHFPEDEDEEPVARRRLAFEELFLFELTVAARRRARDAGLTAPALEPLGHLVDPWAKTLPFAFTGDQQKAAAEIDADLRTERPMQRLLMGEVGSGKTVVALHAMLRAARSEERRVGKEWRSRWSPAP